MVKHKKYKRYSGRGHPDVNNPRHRDLKQYHFAYGIVYGTSQADALRRLKRAMRYQQLRKRRKR